MLSLLALWSSFAGAQTFIDFDNLTPGCNFGGENPLRNQYQAQGVVFSGPGINDGGAVLDQCGNFGVSGHSAPNFLAFNDGSAMANGGLADQPETMTFNPPAQVVSFVAASAFGGTLIATAYDAAGAQVDQDLVPLNANVQPVTVTGIAISTVVFDIVADYFIVDDLYFESQADADGDGFESGPGGDCNDGNANVHPGAVEVCDGEDTDCDGVAGPGEEDVDGDGWGTCEGDCDDLSAITHPGAVDICDGGIDNDCNPATDETQDDDGDGFTGCLGDCNDLEAAMYPGAIEICDGLDNDCDPATDEDADPDGDGVPACSDVCPGGDDNADFDGDGVANLCDTCPMDALDDSDGDGVCDTDDRCPGEDDTVDTDTDGRPDACDNCPAIENPGQSDQDDDGAGGACDCDDQDADVWPGADELCDGLDNDCDGETDDDPVDGNTFYADEDGDGEGDAGDSVTACDPPSGHVSDDGDCDDANAAINTAAIELCDAVDNDCDTYVDEELPDCAGGDSAPKLGGCGCASTGGGASGWALAWVVLAARRRRR